MRNRWALCMILCVLGGLAPAAQGTSEVSDPTATPAKQAVAPSDTKAPPKQGDGPQPASPAPQAPQDKQPSDDEMAKKVVLGFRHRLGPWIIDYGTDSHRLHQ